MVNLTAYEPSGAWKEDQGVKPESKKHLGGTAGNRVLPERFAVSSGNEDDGKNALGRR